MSVTEGDGNVPQDGTPSNQAPPTDLTAAVPTIGKNEKTLSIEEAKAVTTALLTPWSQDQLQKQEIQRLWPDVDSILPRGTLHSPLNASIRPPGFLQQGGGGIGSGGSGRGNGSGPSRKRPRTDQHQRTTTITAPPEPAFPILQDGTLEKPSIPGVSPATIDQVIKNIRKSCGECAPCLLKASGHRRGPETQCPTLKAVKAWDAEFGGVPYSKAEEIAKKLAQPLMHGKSVWKKRKRVGDGLRCEACRACRSEAEFRCRCNFVKATSSKTLPERFKSVIEAAEAAVLENLPPSVQSTVAAAAANQISLEKYIEQMPGMKSSFAEGTLQTGTRHTAPVENVSGGGKEENEDEEEDEREEEDEENVRWAGWAPFLSHPQARHYTTTSTAAGLSSIGSGGGHSNLASDFTHLSTKQQVALISRRLGVEPDSLIDWICTARVVVEENIQNTREEEGKRVAPSPPTGADGGGGPSSSESESGRAPLAAHHAPLTTECGHVNSRNIFHCESCNTARWSGPVGQLSTRIISALQSGILAGTAGRSIVDIDSELAGTVAARIAAEAGPGAEELPEMDELMDEVHNEIQRVRATAKGASVGAGAAEVGLGTGARHREREEQMKVIGGIARRTKMAKSVVKLENTIGRLVEEQAALLEFNRAKKKQKINKTGEKCIGVLDSNQKRMEELINLRTLLIEAKEQPFDWLEEEEEPPAPRGAAAVVTTRTVPSSSSKRQRSGKSGVSGIERPSFLGYSAFNKRLLHSLIGDASSITEAAFDAAGYQSLSEILFTSAPPCSALSTPSSTSTFTSSLGWTEAMVIYLESVLQDVQATKQLMLASQIGGPGSLFTHVVWALLQRQQQQRRREREAAAAQGAGGGVDGRGSQRENPSQPSQPHNPFIIPTQQSQPEFTAHPLSQIQPQSQPQSQSQGATAAVEVSGVASASITTNNSELGTSIALLDDLINSIDKPSADAVTTTTATTSDVEKEEHGEEEKFDQHRFNVTNHITSTTLQFIYSLTHAVLNSVAQKEARERMPVHLTPFIKTILEYAQFPHFPPLPAPPLSISKTTAAATTAATTTAAATTTRKMVPNRFDIHDIIKPIPDSRQPVHGMVKGVLPSRGRLRGIASDQERQRQKQLPQARSGGFSAWKRMESTAGRSSAAGTSASAPSRAEGEVERSQQRQQAGNPEIIQQCPVDVQLVFSEAVNTGVRSELVYKAAVQYLETVNLEKRRDGTV